MSDEKTDLEILTEMMEDYDMKPEETLAEFIEVIQDAEAYRSQTVAEATGETSRFLQIYEQYKKAPAVTRQRMYLETMERILGENNKTIIDTGSQSNGVVPYLPLTELPQTPPPRQQPPRTSSGGTQ